MALDELKGQTMGTQKVQIERGPVRVFADALMDDDPVYREDGAPVPTTFPFVMSYWGSLGQGGAAGLPIEKLRGPGRAILHGEQEFVYTRMPRVGIATLKTVESSARACTLCRVASLLASSSMLPIAAVWTRGWYRHPT